MPLSLKKPLAVIFTGLLSLGAQAATSVVCRNEDGSIKLAEVLDLFEGREILGRTYEDGGIGMDARIQLAQLNVTNHPFFLKKLRQELALVKSRIVFVSNDTELPPSNDPLPTIQRRGCSYEQLSGYAGGSELLVSSEIYAKLDDNSKAALHVHEATSSLYRKLGDKNSQAARRLVAHLMASNVDYESIGNLIKKSFQGPLSPQNPLLAGVYTGKGIDCPITINGLSADFSSAYCLGGKRNIKPLDGYDDVYLLHTWDYTTAYIRVLNPTTFVWSTTIEDLDFPEDPEKCNKLQRSY